MTESGDELEAMEEAGLIPLGEAFEAHEDAREVFALEEGARIRREAAAHTPMHAVEAEKELVGLALRFGHEIVMVADEERLQARDFVTRSLRLIWEAICALDAVGEAIDVIPVVDELVRRGKLENVGGMATVTQLYATLSNQGFARWRARMIVEKARLRSVMVVLDEAKLAASIGKQPDEVCDKAIAKLSDIANVGGSTTADMMTVMRDIEATTPLLGGKREGSPTGFIDIDSQMLLVDRDLIVVAARPSMGKTSFTLNLTAHQVLRRQRPVHFFSLEMNAVDASKFILQSEARISLRANYCTPEQRTRLADAQARLIEAPLYIDESSSLTIGELCAKARAHAVKNPPGLVVVDYIQLVTAPGFENKALEIGEVTRRLKQLARELRCPVVALSQLNRGVESRADKRPGLADLRESGAIEQDADVVAFLYREEYYLREKTPEDRKNLAEFIIAKHRKGPTGTVDLRFFGEWTRFDNAARSNYV